MGTFQARPEWVGKNRKNTFPQRDPATFPTWPTEGAPANPPPNPAVNRETEFLTEFSHYSEPDRPCGARRPTGMACGRPVLPGEMVCEPCARAIMQAEFKTFRGREWIMRQVGDRERHLARHESEDAAAAREERAAERRSQQRAASAIHVVYYVRTGVNLVKIGTTGNMRQRIKGIFSDMSCLLAVEPGDRRLEKQRHRELAKWRFDADPRSEKFAEGPEVKARIEAVLAEHGDPHQWLAAAEAARDQTTEEKSA